MKNNKIRYIKIGNAVFPVYKRTYKTRPRNQPTYVMSYWDAAEKKRRQLNRVSWEELQKEAARRYSALGSNSQTKSDDAEKLASRLRELENNASDANMSLEDCVYNSVGLAKLLGTKEIYSFISKHKYFICDKYVPTPVEEVVTRFIRFKESQYVGKTYLDQMKCLLPTFSSYFNGKTFGEITSSEINRYLESLSLKPNSFRAHYGLIKTMSGFAQMNHYLPQTMKPQIFFVVKPKYKLSRKIIISPENLKELLNNIDDLNLLLFVLFSSFAGIRTCEFKKVCWADIKNDVMRLDYPITKSGTAARSIPIQKNLLAWIAPFKERKDNVCDSLSFHGKLKEVAKRTGINVTRNIFRRSYGSHRSQALKSADIAAREMGHSATIFNRVYYVLPEEDAAKKYFEIYPPEDWHEKWQDILNARKSQKNK